jgi:hypothetical protein
VIHINHYSHSSPIGSSPMENPAALPGPPVSLTYRAEFRR